MDKTLEYQKMCVEAFKDIGYVKPTAGPNLMIPAPCSIQGQRADGIMMTFVDEFNSIGLGSTVARPVGQLYQQDQLQEMLNKTTYFLLMDFTNEVDSKWGYESCCIDKYSMEQLWLAFVMKEKYNKEWKDNTWKKAE